MLERILAGNNRRGGAERRAQETHPAVRDADQQRHLRPRQQIHLFTGGDRSYFAAAGIGDLQRYFQSARRRTSERESSIALFNLLEEIVIRRTRPFIKATYPNATINGKPITWPDRKLKTVRYDLEATYGGIYDRIVHPSRACVSRRTAWRRTRRRASNGTSLRRAAKRRWSASSRAATSSASRAASTLSASACAARWSSWRPSRATCWRGACWIARVSRRRYGSSRAKMRKTTRHLARAQTNSTPARRRASSSNSCRHSTRRSMT